MAGPIRISILSNASQAKREINSTAGSLGGLASRAAKVATVIGGALVARKAFEWGKEVVSAASDAQQSLGATQTVFGKYASTVIKRSNQAAEALGLSADEYRTLSNVTGAMLKSAGTPLKKVTDLTDKLNTRAADMAATFGGTTKDAVEAVSSLLRGEADPIERYGVSIKQSDVNARLAAKGLDKLTGKARKQAEQQERLSLLFEQSADTAGQFGRESDTLAGAQQRLSAKVENVKAKIGSALLPILTDLVNWISKKVVPKLEEFAEWLSENRDEISDFGKSLADKVIPPLERLFEIGTNLIGVLSGLPGPLKGISTEVAAAAFILPKLNGAMQTVTGSSEGFISKLRDAESRTEALGTAARVAAGIAGLAALAEGAKRSDENLGGLLKVAGGAATGFSLGGPWGAAIGGAAGLVAAVVTETKKASSATRRAGEIAKASADGWGTLNDTLFETQGRYTKVAREAAYNDLVGQDNFNTIKATGIGVRTLTNAYLGMPSAQAKITAKTNELSTAIKSNTTEYDRLEDARQNLIANHQSGTKEYDDLFKKQEILHKQTEEYRDQKAGLDELTAAGKRETAQYHEKVRAVGDVLDKYALLPKEVRTQIKALGGDATRKDIRKVVNAANLTPKEKRIVFKALEAKKVIGEAKNVRKSVEDTGKAKPDFGAARNAISKFAGDAKKKADDGAKGVADNLKKGTSKAKPELGPFQSGLTGGISKAKGTASSGGQGVGSALGAGVNSGIAGWIGTIVATAKRAVSTAIAAARSEAEVKSPSRKTTEIGRMMGLGFAKGIQKASPQVKKVMRQLTQAMANQTKKDGSDVIATFTRIAEKAKAALDKALAARNQFAASVRQSAGGYDITSFGSDDGTQTSGQIVQGLRDKLASVAQYAKLLRQLKKAGLNKQTYKELVEKGPEAGLATAEALVAGGKGAITQVNSVTRRIRNEAAKFARTTSRNLYQAGVKSAQGLVDGIKSKTIELSKQAKGFAKELIKAVKKALGIKSPSRVFREIGQYTVEGLKVGLDGNAVKRQGQGLASMLKQGFRTPALSAMADLGMAGGGRQEFTIRLSAQQLDQISRGRQITADIQAYETSGGRKVAR